MNVRFVCNLVGKMKKKKETIIIIILVQREKFACRKRDDQVCSGRGIRY